MATYTGTANDDSWTVINPGTFTLNGLGGVDSLYLGTSLRSSYTITQAADGSVHIDSISGASGQLHATLQNMEKLYFNSGRDLLDLSTYFGDHTPPTLAAESPSDNATAVAVGANLVLTFSEPVQRGSGSIVLKNAAGTVIATYDAATSANLSIAGSTLTINPTADLAGATGYTLTLAAGSIKDLSGNAYAGGTPLHFTTAQDHHAYTGTAGNDSFVLGAGINTVDGAAGVDTVVLGGPHSAYTLTQTATSFVLTANDGSATDTLTNVERVQFSDLNVALDLSGHAGEVAKIIGAVFGAAQVNNQSYVGIGLQLADGGMAYDALAALAVGVTGQTTHAGVVNLLWTNVMGSAPTPEQAAPFVSLLDNGMSVGTLATLAADTPQNTAHIDLIGLTHTGLDFI